MEYTNWDCLIIVLSQNNLEINVNLIMRRDIDAMDSLSIKNLLSEISNSMELDSVKSQYGISDCKNWDEIEMRLMLNDNIHKNFKSTRIDFDNNPSNLGYFLYNEFITLSSDDIDNQQTYIPSETLYSQELIINQPEPNLPGISATFKTVDGLTVVIKNGLVISIG